MSDLKKKPMPEKSKDPNAWVAKTQIALFIDGQMIHLVPEQELPTHGITADALRSMVKLDQVCRARDYKGPSINCPISAPAPLAVATVSAPRMPVIRDEYGMVKPDPSIRLPGDDPNFRIDKSRTIEPAYIRPGHGVEVMNRPGAPGPDGFTEVNWNSSVMRNNLPIPPVNPEAVSCVECSRDFADFQSLKVHEAKEHFNQSFHEHLHG